MREEEGVPNGTARKCSKWNRRRGKHEKRRGCSEWNGTKVFQTE